MNTASPTPRRGVILIFTAGALVILAATGLAFFVLARCSMVGAIRHSDMVRAEFLMQAGLADAIARLRQQAHEKPEDASDPWFTTNDLDGRLEGISFPVRRNGTAHGCSGILGSSVVEDGDRYTLQVSDAASRINVNAGDNLAVLLDNLCRLIGPPLVAADLDALQPRRWAQEGAPARLYETATNVDDTADRRDLRFRSGADGRPLVDDAGVALYGDGYAIAGFRARQGCFSAVDDLREALTYVERNGNGHPDDPLEAFEIEVKWAALRPYVTTDSPIDTTTVGTGKFEWSDRQGAIDRDKSWIPGDLAGHYLTIVNGHGAGQLRRIRDNGIDWVTVEADFVVPPGPISSYMIFAREDALRTEIAGTQPPVDLPEADAAGNFSDDPSMDYARRPLCIHRAPINVNTASDKVLAAVFMGLAIQHGHPMAVGTDADLETLQAGWFTEDLRLQEPCLLTKAGVKRLPAASGRVVFDRPRPEAAVSPQFDYIHGIDPTAHWNEAQELAFRIILARQSQDATGRRLDADPFTGWTRGPFRSWDDLYHRVVKPWDDLRSRDPRKASVARLLMANVNPNTGLLKFNPNIEWIDRWGRNYTEMEPVMLYRNADDPDAPIFVPAFEGEGPTAPDADDPGGQAPVSLWPYHLCKYGAYDAATRQVRRLRGVDWGAYLIRSMRYRSTELIDKSDLNCSTTELAFDSGGVYHIVSTGQVYGACGLLAERKAQTVVRIYDIWRETTQEQFARGCISVAAGAPGTSMAGQVTRADVCDYASGIPRANVNTRLALSTFPEPLMPLDYRLRVNPYYKDVVDTSATGTDAFGRAKVRKVNEVMPDSLANGVLPARYDGQLLLATNTAQYDPDNADTFLASFNGDLDTDTCRGNGRELARTPASRSTRCVDTVGLLGRLNDTEIDFDPSPIGARGNALDPNVYALDPHDRIAGFEMRPLSAERYWENVTCRMGDLRPDGVWLGYAGGSLKEATLKYKFHHNGEGGRNYLNYNPDEGAAGMGSTIAMWFKPSWHCTDGREHEFFNANNKGTGFDARYNVLTKAGRFLGACQDNHWAGGTLFPENSLCWAMEDADDSVVKTFIHGGSEHPVPECRITESPAYRTQPFRWSFVGCVSHYCFDIHSWASVFGTEDRRSFGFSVDTEGYTGASDWKNPVSQEILALHTRPFISTARGLEGEGFIPGPGGSRPSTRFMWGYCDLQTQETEVLVQDPEDPELPVIRKIQAAIPQIRYPDIGMGTEAKQQLAWFWQDGRKDSACFAINATNEKPDGWVNRTVPTDGTMAVIDEFRICSGRMWDTMRIRQEMQTSRYYLPDDPRDRAQCPTFTSQSMLQSLRGAQALQGNCPETVELARVTWSVFTPRFMHENRAQACSRREYVRTGNTAGERVEPASTPFQGPFDYVQYNHQLGIPEATINEPRMGLGVDRPSPPQYRAAGARQAHATRGVEIELLDGQTPLEGQSMDPDSGRFEAAVRNDEMQSCSIFIDPETVNRVGTSTQSVAVRADRLRYRIRFRYPVDPLVKQAHRPEDPLAPDEQVDPANHYLLDTPVFDDISVVYLTRTRFLGWKNLTE